MTRLKLPTYQSTFPKGQTKETEKTKGKTENRAKTQISKKKTILLSREVIRIRGSASTGELPTKAQSRQSSPEESIKRGGQDLLNAKQSITEQNNQEWANYRAKKLRTPCLSPHYRAKSDERRPSSITTASRVKVHAPPEVFAKTPCPATAV